MSECTCLPYCGPCPSCEDAAKIDKAESDLAALRAKVEALAGEVEAQGEYARAAQIRALLPGGDDANPNGKETKR